MPINLQLEFLAAFPPPSPSLGDFAHSFPNVNDLTKHLGGLSLSDLHLFIEDEQNRTGEKIEVFSVKLPLDAITFWGMVLLLITAIYFWVTFRDFANRQTSGNGTLNVPWIGNSDDIVSRFVFYLTLFFPLYTAGHLSWIGFHSEDLLYRRVLYGLGPCAIAVLIVGIVLSYRRITATRNIANAGVDLAAQ